MRFAFMSCTNPRCAIVPQSGGSPIFCHLSDWPRGTFVHPHYGVCKVVYLPCGGCLACRRERRMELTLLQCCEASLHDDNWFITLTYDDAKTFELTDFLPYSLDRSHLSAFCESMRKHARYKKESFRFFACGEYGEKYERPHYHLSVFGLSPSALGLPYDEDVEKTRRVSLHNGRFIRVRPGLFDDAGNEYWQSSVISKYWKYGNHKIYRANKDTFQYVAGYVTKKLTGEQGKAFRASGRVSEFQVQSRPSIGWPWFLRYYHTLSNFDAGKLCNDSLSIAGVDWKIPRIFGRWLSALDPDGADVAKRISGLRQLDTDVLPDRVDLSRISAYDEYRRQVYKQTNKHKEIQ